MIPDPEEERRAILASRPTSRRTWSCRPATGRRPRPSPKACGMPRPPTPGGSTAAPGTSSVYGPWKVAVNHCRQTPGQSPPLPGPPGGRRQGHGRHGHHRPSPCRNLPRPCRRVDRQRLQPRPQSRRGRNGQGLAESDASAQAGRRARRQPRPPHVSARLPVFRGEAAVDARRHRLSMYRNQARFLLFRCPQ